MIKLPTTFGARLPNLLFFEQFIFQFLHEFVVMSTTYSPVFMPLSLTYFLQLGVIKQSETRILFCQILQETILCQLHFIHHSFA